MKNITRHRNGRYVVRLPLRDGDKRLGNSRSTALKRLNFLERKLESDPTLKNAYSQTIQEYLDSDRMSPLDDPVDNGYATSCDN